MAEDLILKMAQTHYDALGVPEGINPAFKVSWDSLEPQQRDRLYDAMWTAVHVLLEPEMLSIANGAAGEFYKDVEASELWLASVHKLLEVE